MNLNKLLQIKSFLLDEKEEQNFIESESKIPQTQEYDVSKIELFIDYKKKILNNLDIHLTNKQLSSIFTRIYYAINYIDRSNMENLRDLFRMYIYTILNSFMVVVLEDKKEIDFRNVVTSSSVYENNYKVLEKYKNEYQWLYTFINSKIWLCLRDYFSVELDTFILGYDFNATLRSLHIPASAKTSLKAKNMILENNSGLTYEDVGNLIGYLNRTLTHKYKKKLIGDLENYRKTLPKKENKSEKKTQNESN